MREQRRNHNLSILQLVYSVPFVLGCGTSVAVAWDTDKLSFDLRNWSWLGRGHLAWLAGDTTGRSPVYMHDYRIAKVKVAIYAALPVGVVGGYTFGTTVVDSDGGLKAWCNKTFDPFAGSSSGRVWMPHEGRVHVRYFTPIPKLDETSVAGQTKSFEFSKSHGPTVTTIKWSNTDWGCPWTTWRQMSCTLLWPM